MKQFELIKKITDTTITRILPTQGKMLVAVNDQVIPSTLIAEVRKSLGYHTVNIAHAFKVAPSAVKQYLKMHEGQSVYKNEILAEKPRFLHKESLKIQVPADGIIEHIDLQTGQVVIRLIKNKESIPSGVWGSISSIENELKVSIITQLLQINAKDGRGFEREGQLKVIAPAHTAIREYMIKPEHVGKILVGGAGLTGDAILKATRIGVTGIIVGSCNYHNVREIGRESDIGTTILITEGYGSVSMNQFCLDTLVNFDNAYAFINGHQKSLRISAEKTKLEKINHQAANLVRVIFDEYSGQIGEIISETQHQFDSGVLLPAVTLKTLNGKQLTVPKDNIELLSFSP